MRKVLLCCAFVCLFAACGFAAGRLDPAKEPKSFRGIKWGQNIDTIKDIEYAGGNAPLTAFKRKNETMSMGTAELLSISYGAYDRKFANVMLKALDKNALLLFKEAEKLYGKGFCEQAIEDNTIRGWLFPMVEINCIYDSKKKETSLMFLYRPFKDDFEKAMKKQME